MGLFLILLLVIGTPLLIIYSILSENKENKKEREEVAKEAIEWFAAEKLKPRYQILITQKDGVEFTSAFYEPSIKENWGWPEWAYDKHTSRDHAVHERKRLLEPGLNFITNFNGKFIPVTDVLSIEFRKEVK